MKTRGRLPLLVCCVVALLTYTCTILKPEDPEAKVRAFISTFGQALNESDETILNLFDAQQSSDAILAAVRVLQNADEYAIACEAYFDQATITFEETGVRVDIPTKMSVDTLEYTDSRDATISLMLSPKKDSFVITRLEGQNFYDVYLTVKGYLAEVLSEGQVLEHIREYALTAQSLQEKYDSAVWVAEYGDNTYYYVVNGSWTETRNENFLMGMVDESGKEIIPVEYDMIGTPGFDWPGIVEVRISNQVGLFHLEQGEIVSPGFEWIAPYEEMSVFALVKTDSTYGWLDKSYTYHAGFPSDAARTYVADHEFLPTGTEYSKNTMTLCEIPSEEHYGSGYLIFPAYLTSTGMFEEVRGDFAMYSNTWRANTESVAVSHEFFDSVVDGVNMLLTSISSRYLDGREAFYTSNQVSFLDKDGSVVGTSTDVMSTDIVVTKIDSTVFEIRVAYSSDGYEIYDESSDETETNIPQYLYFSVEEGSPSQLTSNRVYNFTEFVKIDSSYLTGEFTYIGRESMNYETRNFLCDSTLMRMRNEILANYGYIFPDEQTTEHFKFNNWYSPRHEVLADFDDQLTDIDRHNLKFLEKILGPIPEKKESI